MNIPDWARPYIPDAIATAAVALVTCAVWGSVFLLCAP